MFDVTTYGATGNGTTDDSTAVQSAIAAAEGVGGGEVFFPAGTYRLNTGLTVAQGKSVVLAGDNRATAILSYRGSATAVTIGTSSGSTLFAGVQDLTIDLSQSSASSGTGNGIDAVQTHFLALHRLRLTTKTSGSTGTGINLQGTGDWTGNSDWDAVQVTGNWSIGVDINGPSTNKANNHHLRHVSVTRTTDTPGTGTIGIRFGANCGDNYIAMGDVENYDTGYHILGDYTRGFVRAESNTTGIVLDSGSSHTWLFVSPFSNTTDVSYAGANNSIVQTDNVRSYRDANGDVLLKLDQHTNTGNCYLYLRAGATAGGGNGKICAVRWNDATDTTVFQWMKTTWDILELSDGTGAIRMALRATANDDIELRSSGTGKIRLNVDGLGVNAGSGGIIGGDGTSTATWGVTGAGAPYFGRATITYSASMTPNAAAGRAQLITATNGTAFTINAPTNPVTGQYLTIRIKNASGGALGAATWNATFKMSTWTQPGSATSQAITFEYNGTNWVEVSRTAADIPN